MRGITRRRAARRATAVGTDVNSGNEACCACGGGLTDPTPISNCKTQNDTTCSACDTGYTLKDNACSATPITSCKTQSGATCSACDTGYTLKNNTCSITPIAFCETQKGSTCSVCDKGYSLKDNKCSPTPITNCLTQKEITCSACDAGYDLSNNTCGASKINNCKTQTDITCSACNSGYSLSKNTCIATKIKNCQTQKGTVCSECIKGYDLSNNFCNVGQIKYCKTQTGAVCSACNGGYDLSNNICMAGNIPNCQKQNGIICSACNTGYTLKDNICSKNPPHLSPGTCVDKYIEAYKETGCDAVPGSAIIDWWREKDSDSEIWKDMLSRCQKSQKCDSCETENDKEDAIKECRISGTPAPSCKLQNTWSYNCSSAPPKNKGNDPSYPVFNPSGDDIPQTCGTKPAPIEILDIPRHIHNTPDPARIELVRQIRDIVGVLKKRIDLKNKPPYQTRLTPEQYKLWVKAIGGLKINKKGKKKPQEVTVNVDVTDSRILEYEVPDYYKMNEKLKAAEKFKKLFPLLQQKTRGRRPDEIKRTAKHATSRNQKKPQWKRRYGNGSYDVHSSKHQLKGGNPTATPPASINFDDKNLPPGAALMSSHEKMLLEHPELAPPPPGKVRRTAADAMNSKQKWTAKQQQKSAPNPRLESLFKSSSPYMAYNADFYTETSATGSLE